MHQLSCACIFEKALPCQAVELEDVVVTLIEALSCFPMTIILYLPALKRLKQVTFGFVVFMLVCVALQFPVEVTLIFLSTFHDTNPSPTRHFL